MKKILIAALLLLMMFPVQSFAATYHGTIYYVPYLDQYRVDYYYNSGDVRYDLVFNSADGTTYTANYNFPPSGIHYLTCNGTYNMNFYDAAGTVLHTLGPMVTTIIKQPTCDSYPDGVSGKNDLGLTNNGLDLAWNAKPGAATYEVWKDGELLGTTPGTSYTLPEKGSISVVAKDSSGNIVGRSDLSMEEEGTGEEGCDVCTKLSELLECPDWDRYMGELSQAIHNGLPTLPEWRQIADQFRDSFAEYFGEVPTPPSVQQIEQKITPELPKLDTEVPEVQPAAPADYNNGPIPFDITSGPQIEVVDNSEAFEIYEPNKYINADTAGTMVFPKDSRNHSDGIKEPNKFVSPYETPTPTVRQPSEIPPSNMPTPTTSTNTTLPKPKSSGGVIPIPTTK